MKRQYLLGALCLASCSLSAQDSFHLFLKDGSRIDYLTSEVDSMVFVHDDNQGGQPNIPEEPNPGEVTEGAVKILASGGWFESAYAEWESYSNAANYNVYSKASSSSNYEKVDAMLVRNYGTHIRVDVLGLKAGKYDLKVLPVVNGKETGTPTIVSLNVEAHDRSGFAHKGGVSVGAYNNDGTLKSNAVVIYVTEKNKSSITADVYTSASKTTTCTGISAIMSALQKGYEQRPFCIRLIGQLTADGMTGSGDSNNLLLKASNADRPVKNVTIEGVGNDATCYGFGVRGIRANNCEFRNLGIMLFGDDGIAFETNNKNCWVHHNDIFYGTAGSDADQAKGDGSLDVKDDSQYMTFSYNHFYDSGKMSLCGMKSETGPNYITYHHNWFDHSDSRHPRVRTMSVHVYNNYYDGVAKYGVGAVMGASVFVEANYFRNVAKPMMIGGQGTDALGDGTFSGEPGAMIKSFNNYFTEKPSKFSFITQKENATSFDAYNVTNRQDAVPSSVKSVLGGNTYDNFDTNSSLMYSYTPDDPTQVAKIVSSNAGRMGGGDFKWQFNNAKDDASYSLNTDLMSAIKAYKTSLISSLGE